MTTHREDTRRRRPCGILVVDDDERTRGAARLVLEEFGFAVNEARTGYEALVVAQLSHPRVVLVDVVLPEIDGLQLVRMLRADPTMHAMAIVAVTATAAADGRERAFAAGCDGYFVKPVAPLELVDAIRRYVRRPATAEYDFDPLERDAPEVPYESTSIPSPCSRPISTSTAPSPV